MDVYPSYDDPEPEWRSSVHISDTALADLKSKLGGASKKNKSSQLGRKPSLGPFNPDRKVPRLCPPIRPRL